MPKNNKVLARLTPAQWALVSPFMERMQIRSGETLYQPGEVVQAVYFPTTAVLSVVTVMSDGRCVEAATIGNESAVGIVGALSGMGVHARTFAQVEGVAYRLAATRLRPILFDDPKMMRHFLTHVQGDIAQSEQSVACNALHSVRQRLARWLLLTQDRVGSPEFAMTQEYLSIMMGVQRTTVTAAAQNLRALGSIRYCRGRIAVTDRPNLERLSCECYFATAASQAGPRDDFA